MRYDDSSGRLMITFQTQSRLLGDRIFEQVESFKTMDDWRLFNLALFHGQAKIVKIERIGDPITK